VQKPGIPGLPEFLMLAAQENFFLVPLCLGGSFLFYSHNQKEI
jgi:hypothetical protein